MLADQGGPFSLDIRSHPVAEPRKFSSEKTELRYHTP